MPFIGLLSILGEAKSLGKLTLAPIIHLLKAPCAEGILNKIVKAINEIFAGLKCMPNGFRTYFV